MRKAKFIFQELLKFSLIFLLMFVWTRYFLKSLSSAVIVALLATGIIYFSMFMFSRKKHHKAMLSLKEKEDAENMFLSLATSDNAIDFLEKLAQKKHKQIEKKENYITITYPENDAKTILYFHSSFNGLDIASFMEIYKKIKHENATKVVICCKQIADKQLSSFVLNFKEKYLLFDQYETFRRLYKFYDCFPEMTHCYSKEKRMVFKDFVAYSFNKKRTKSYLFSSFVLILSGLFVRASLYYCIIASILVVFAIISQFNPYFNTKSDSEVL
ncbi:MAG: hypothetical protein J6J24_03880 [Clostridia bacterium]|nr:hypothetical protein [Clostridia bacterium]